MLSHYNNITRFDLPSIDDFEKPGLSVKTKCDTVNNYYKESTKVKLEITLCQNGQCCSTGEIPAQLKECATNTYQTDYQFQKFTTLIMAILHKRRL